MYEVSVQGRFFATHQILLPDLTPEPLHGHDWVVRAVWRGPALDARGVLVDFVAVERAMSLLTGELEQKNLNLHGFFEDVAPSAENVARILFDQLDCVSCASDAYLWSVRVTEAPGCEAAFIRQGTVSASEHADHAGSRGASGRSGMLTRYGAGATI